MHLADALKAASTRTAKPSMPSWPNPPGARSRRSEVSCMLALFLGPALLAMAFDSVAAAVDGYNAQLGKPSPPVFSEADYDWYRRGYKVGPQGILEGRLVRRMRDGKTIPMPHVKFTLLPATDFSAWVGLQALTYGGSGWRYSPPSEYASGFINQFETHDDGTFEAYSLPLGVYYLLASVDLVYGKSEPSQYTAKGYDGNGRQTDVVVPHLRYPHGELYALSYSKTLQVASPEPNSDQVGDIEPLQMVHNPKLLPDPGSDAKNYLLDPNEVAYPDAYVPAEAELAPYGATGAGRISGRLILPLEGIPRLEQKDLTVALLPAVQWSYAWATSLEYNVFNQSTVLDFPLWAKSYVRFARTDERGRFEFDSLPPGRYIVGALVDYLNKYTDTSQVYEGSDYVENEVSTDFYKSDENGATAFDHTEYSTETELVPRYNTVTSTPECRVRDSLLALVDLGAGQSVTTPIADTHWFKDGGGCRSGAR